MVTMKPEYRRVDPDMEKFLPWFSLKSVSGIGNLLFKRLIDRFGAPEHVFQAGDSEILQVQGISRQHLESIRKAKVPERDRKDLECAREKGYRILPLTDPEYPELLRQIIDPPPILFVYGHLDVSPNNVAIVGSRNGTRYGRLTARRLASELAERGIIVTSGMARGVDTTAHLGALDVGGKTIAVLGSGLEKIYPPENRTLYHQIAEKGAVISEFSLFADPDGHHFPMRNRIISGLSLGTVVVEASEKSGSLITARLAAEQGREVFSVPGNVSIPESTGSNNLLRQGACLVESADDIIEELKYRLVMQELDMGQGSTEKQINEMPDLNSSERLVFECLGEEPIHIDEITRKTNLPSPVVSSTLLGLELKNIILQSPGNLFSVNKMYIR